MLSSKRIAATLFALSLATPLYGQLRVVTYNTGPDDPRPGLQAVLQGIADEARQGFARPIDVLALQEQESSATTTQMLVELLNSIYGPGTYARGTLDVQTSGGGRPGLIFYTTSLQLLGQTAIGAISTLANARQTARYHLRPIGYDSNSDFYLYVDHYKSGQTGTDRQRRDAQAATIRANADSLPTGSHVVMMGDLNIYSHTEPMWSRLTGPIPTSNSVGRVYDPLQRIGDWHENNAFRDVHTQSPTTTARYPGQVTGGVDDRFDWQLVNGEMLDGEGLSIIPGSYHAFGNNGAHALNGPLDVASNSALPASILSAIASSSDHLPVVADYQLPSKMLVNSSPYPTQVLSGATATIAVTVRNSAPVIHPLGADELDYLVTTNGALAGNFSGTTLAFASGNTHALTLDTTGVGAKSGDYSVRATSEGAAASAWDQSLTFTVLDHAQPSWNSAYSVSLIEVDFGFIEYGSHATPIRQLIHNRINTVGLTAKLDLDTVLLDNPTAFATTAVPFKDLPAGGELPFELSINPTVYGEVTGSVTFSFSDQDLPGEIAATELSIAMRGLIALSGDATLDGSVDELDFSILQSNYGRTDSQWQDGDFNGDQIVNGFDFAILQNSFGSTVDNMLSMSVPEPHGNAAFLGGLIWLGGQLSRKLSSHNLPA
ncbi:MAG: hypothetical protein O2931_08070 [Planctomycetota bacterium]|nr:hypothetical protein [Planctomycetota bacterium]